MVFYLGLGIVVVVCVLIIYLALPYERLGKKATALSNIEKDTSSTCVGQCPYKQGRDALNTRRSVISSTVFVGKPEPVLAHQCDFLSLPKQWNHETVREFYDEFVVPYKTVLEKSGHLRKILTLLNILDAHGDCPSIVNVQDDTEYESIENVYGLLSRITLLEHSLNVAREMISKVFKTTKDPELSLGKVIVTALGHDIGKIPDLVDSRKYSKGDHAYISYLVMKRVILPDDQFPQREEILSAIKEHHFNSTNEFTILLRKADQAARENETEQLANQGRDVSNLLCAIRKNSKTSRSSNTTAKDAQIKPDKARIPQLIDLSWMDLQEFLSLIEPEINRVDENDRFCAFSMNNGLVYLMLSLVSETVFTLVKKHNHPEVLVHSNSLEKKRCIEYTVKTMLERKGFIPSFIAEGYSGARFALINSHGKRLIVGTYMPVVSQAFRTPLSELERRKNNLSVLSTIAEVRPLLGPGSGRKK